MLADSVLRAGSAFSSVRNSGGHFHNQFAVVTLVFLSHGPKSGRVLFIPSVAESDEAVSWDNDSYGVVTALESNVTAVCASALPFSVAPVFSTIAV